MSTLQNAGENQAITPTETDHMEITDIYKNMKKKFSRLLVGFSVAQIIIGILCLIFYGVNLGKFLIYFHANVSMYGHGFPTGIMFIITGAIGLAAEKVKKKCLADAIFALETVLAILALMEVGCAIGASVVCCTIGACCCDCDCGCCCPLTILRYKMLDNGEQPSRAPDRQQPTGMPYQQPATIVFYPSQPTYMPCANQMTISAGQQQPVILLNPNQIAAQYNPQQVPASSNFQNPENSGMRSSTDCYEQLEICKTDVYEQLEISNTQPNRSATPSDH